MKMDSISPPQKPQQEPQPDLKQSNPTGSTQVPAEQSQQAKPKKKRSVAKIILTTLIALAILAVIAFGAVYFWYQAQLQPVSGKEIATEFVIEPGMGAVTISDSLQSKELIKSSTAFQFYLKQRGDSAKLRAGTYLLSPSLSASEIANVLVDGKTAQKLVTVSPGVHLGKIQDSLVKQGFDEAEVEQALARKDLLPELKPTNSSLEGYLFPESYSMPLDATANDVVERAAEHFQEKISPELIRRVEESGLTLHEAVTLASIIQGESDSSEEQKKIATVFLNRLDQDMPLGADPTFRYAAYLLGVPETPSVDSPYNTRINKGLPPGPISNFKVSAIEAVISPDSHDYLYFVTGDDGKFYYSDTLEEHESKVDKYCIELCKL